MAHVWHWLPKQIDEDDLKAIMAVADPDQDGRISMKVGRIQNNLSLSDPKWRQHAVIMVELDSFIDFEIELLRLIQASGSQWAWAQP